MTRVQPQCFIQDFRLWKGRGIFCATKLLNTIPCDLLWENRPNRQLLQNEIEAHKIDPVIIAVGDKIAFYKCLNPHYFLNILVKFDRLQALRKW